MSSMPAIAMFLPLFLQDAKGPQFEVASIKPAAPDARGMYFRTTPGGTLNITNMSLKEMIIFAWRIQPYQLSGGPPWLDSLRFDVTAKPENNPKQDELRAMLKALLADRFQLTTHQESKELPIYALVLARKDGKLGPSLPEAKDGGCTTPDPTQPRTPPEPGKAPPRYCGNMMMGMRTLTIISGPVGNMVPMLARMLGRTVIDKTGLTGKYDVSLEWTPDEAQLAMLPPDVPRPAPSEMPGPTIYTALQEQLGLKLEAQKGPVDVLIIDRAEKPTAN